MNRYLANIQCRSVVSETLTLFTITCCKRKKENNDMTRIIPKKSHAQKREMLT